MKTQKQQIIISKETAEFIAEKLTQMFPKLDKEPTYSLGFQRWSKLNQTQRKAMLFRHNNKNLTYSEVYNLCIEELQN